MANNKYYYRAEVWCGHDGGMAGMSHNEAKDCIEDLYDLIESYKHILNQIVFIGIIKRRKSDNKIFEFTDRNKTSNDFLQEVSEIQCIKKKCQNCIYCNNSSEGLYCCKHDAACLGEHDWCYYYQEEKGV